MKKFVCKLVSIITFDKVCFGYCDSKNCKIK